MWNVEHKGDGEHLREGWGILAQPGFWFGDHIYRASGKEELLGQFEIKESRDFLPSQPPHGAY